MKSCRDVRARIFAVVEGSLPIEETLAIEEHARECPACALELRRVRELQEAFAQLPQPPEDRLDVEEQVERIRAAIDRDVASPARRNRRWKWIAAAGVVLAVAGWLLERALSTRDRASVVVVVPEPPAREAEARIDAPAPASPLVETVLPPPDVAVSPRVDTAVSSPVDTAQLEAARETVRVALADAKPELDTWHTSRFLARFDASTEALARDRWPIVRLVEHVGGENDDTLSIAALRWLGLRGDALSARRVALALGNPARKAAAVNALIDLWPVGGDAIVPALLDDDLRDAVLDGVATGDAPGAVDLLIKATRNPPRPLDVRIAIDEVTQHRLVAAIPWLEGLVRERSSRGDPERATQAALALEALLNPDSLHALLRLRAAPRAPEIGIDAAIGRMLISSETATTALARELVRSKDGRGLRELNEVLLAEPGPSIVPALIVIAASRELSLGDRRFAILLAAEQGRAEHVPALTDLFREIERRDRGLKAAVLVALHALGGRTAVADALAEAPRSTRERALSVLDSIDAERKPETTLLQLMKELEPKLVPLQL